MTVMRRLSDKELLDRTRTGRQDSYAPRLSRQEYQELRAGAQVRGLVDQFGDVALAHFTPRAWTRWTPRAAASSSAWPAGCRRTATRRRARGGPPTAGFGASDMP